MQKYGGAWTKLNRQSSKVNLLSPADGSWTIFRQYRQGTAPHWRRFESLPGHILTSANPASCKFCSMYGDAFPRLFGHYFARSKSSLDRREIRPYRSLIDAPFIDTGLVV